MHDRTDDSPPGIDQDLEAFWSEAAATGLVRRLLELARDEDLGPDRLDRTALAVRRASGRADPAPRRRVALRLREPGVVAGLRAIPVALDVFGARGVSCERLRRDADHADDGTRLAEFTGPVEQIVTLERTVLNIVGRLSGVATRTAEFVAKARLSARGIEVLDTRKTTPGMRLLEKYAVRCGGGASHRLGLHDAVLLKDNHLAAATADLGAWLAEAATTARSDPASPPGFVQVEVDTLGQLDEVLGVEPGLINLVLLDNFSTGDLREAVRRRDDAGSAIRLEASGGVSLETIGAIAATGVERISVGSLTHGARSLDVGFDDLGPV